MVLEPPCLLGLELSIEMSYQMGFFFLATHVAHSSHMRERDRWS
jgi:hypothetical protein